MVLWISLSGAIAKYCVGMELTCLVSILDDKPVKSPEFCPEISSTGCLYSFKGKSQAQGIIKFNLI